MHKTNEQLLSMVQAKNNMTFGQIRDSWVSENISSTLPKDIVNSNNKGWCGNIIQELVFDVPSNSKSEADFKEKYDNNLELKVTPVNKLKNGTYSPKERLVLGMIDYENMAPDFESSHVLDKTGNMLVTIYLYQEHLKKENYEVLQSLIWDFNKIPEADKNQIKEDYLTVKEKVDDGKAENIHGSDTVILEPMRKGAGGEKDKRKQPFSDVLVHSRGWGLKQSYLKKLYNDAIEGKSTNFTNTLNESSESVVKYLNSIKSKDIFELSHVSMRAKNKNSNAIKKILESWNEDIYEYVKEGQIKVRTMKLKPNGSIQESFLISTSVIDENKIIKEKDFKDSMFYADLNKPYVLVTIREDINHAYVDQAILVNSFLANKEMYNNAQEVWLKAKQYFEIISKNPSEWDKNKDLLVSIKDKMQFHVRPHAKDGKVNYEGTNLTKQAFWINNTALQELFK